jgi:hypothetical protein
MGTNEAADISTRMVEGNGGQAAGQNSIRSRTGGLSPVCQIYPDFRGEAPAVCLAQPNGLGERYRDLKRGNAPAIYKDANYWGK